MFVLCIGLVSGICASAQVDNVIESDDTTNSQEVSSVTDYAKQSTYLGAIGFASYSIVKNCAAINVFQKKYRDALNGGLKNSKMVLEMNKNNPTFAQQLIRSADEIDKNNMPQFKAQLINFTEKTVLYALAAYGLHKVLQKYEKKNRYVASLKWTAIVAGAGYAAYSYYKFFTQ